MEGVPPSSMDDAVNQLEFETFNMSELSWSLPEDDQAGQHMLVDDNTIQQTTWFPPSFPQTMMEGAPPSSVEDDVNFTGNLLELEKLLSLPSSPLEEVLVNQSSILCNDQGGQIMLVDNNDSTQQTTQTMTAMRGLDGTSSSCINQNGPNWPQTPSSDQQWPNQLAMSNQVSGMLPQPPMNQCSQQFPCQFNEVPITPYPYDPQSSTMLPESSQTLRHQNSFIHQPQLENFYMTLNTKISQHGGFNQPGPSLPAPRIQYFPNQGQVDQASVSPNMENMQQENLVPRNIGKSTRSQMESLQVHVLQNQNARPNASNAGPDSSLQSQTRGLNTQQVKMVGSNDSFWNYVEEKDDGRMKCCFCPHTYAIKTSISRIKWHLSGEERRGVAICRGVTKEVKEAALKVMPGGNKRHKSTACSINVSDRGISTCPQKQNIENENMGGDIRRVLQEVQVVDSGTEQMYNVQDTIRVRTEPVEESERSAVQAGAGSNQTRGVPFPTSANKPVGQAFKENTKVIWSLLMDDEVSTIGIYGMGGVGKTTILQHIHNKLLQRLDICDHIWWVTVSQDFSISRLQNLIAERVDLDLSRDFDDKHRAAKLSEELRKKQKWILILDDLWNSFELHDVGIHSSLNGCKLILTTRSQKVCDQIDCQHKIQVKPLFEGESWTLFKENLGRHKTLSDEVEGIAKAIARECAGLPLGIITIARSLRGVDDLSEWRNTLKKLKELKFREMDEKVFKVLRVSYDRLDDGLALKQCLLYCALFPEDHRIKREELIAYLIDEGIIKGMSSRQDAFDEGHTMLNRLQYVCLLESDKTEDGGKCVKMHDLIRDMAIHILQENSNVIVKCGVQLQELPDAEEWTENLKIVSLMQNEFGQIPSSHSPMCPNLSTLLLCQNHWLRFIADSFFKQLHGLKVLDLSHTSIDNLPESVSDLVSLTTLLLRYCRNLRDVPSLEKLRALESLDLYGTSLKKMPQGMECLSNLRYLRINRCLGKEFPSGILPKLSHLQVLALGVGNRGCCIVEGMEVGCLGKLETLECRFKGLSDFVEYLTSRDGIHSLSTYKISVGTLNGGNWVHNYDLPSKTVWLGNLSINRDRDFQVKFLNDIQGLACQCIDARSVCDVLSLENATELEFICIRDCDSMESLVSFTWFCSATLPLPSHNGMFSRLKEFECGGCNSMEKLFPLELLSYLVNLEVISVWNCVRMEEIIGTTEESSTYNPIVELTLPKLKTLELIDLPELKGICSAKLICNSLKVIDVENCKKLKRMAISLPVLENGQPSPHPSLESIDVCPEEWWETVVEWEPPNAKEVLRPIVHSW